MVFWVLLHPGSAPPLWAVLTELGPQGEVDNSSGSLVWTQWAPSLGNQSKVRSHPKGQKRSMIHSQEPLKGVPHVREFSKNGGRKTLITSEWVCEWVSRLIHPHFWLKFVAQWLKSYGSEWVCSVVLWWISYSLVWHQGHLQSRVTRLTLPLMLRGTEVPSGWGQTDIWLVSSPFSLCHQCRGKYIGWK
jgi:hypothetical protein